MENLNYLRENQTNVNNNVRTFLKGKRNLLKESNCTNKVINQASSKANFISQKFNMKSQNVPLKETEKDLLESDVSMLSINDNSQNCRYFLPSSKDFENISVAKRFSEDVINRRNLNRNLTSDKLNKYTNSILSVSFDEEIGFNFVIENFDYMVDIECSEQPLGLNFFEDSNVTVAQRNNVVNNLYSYCDALSVCRLSVTSGMALFDRYIKNKGKSFHCKDLNLLSVTCWYIACKNDLLRYPFIEDICNVASIPETYLITNYEYDILNVVDYYLFIPTSIAFLRPLSVIKCRRGVSHDIGKMFIEICTCIYELAGHPAHILGAAAYCLSMSLSYRNLRFQDYWTPIIQFLTGIDIDDIRPVIIALAKVIHGNIIQKQFPAIIAQYQTLFTILENRRDYFKNVITGKEDN